MHTSAAAARIEFCMARDRGGGVVGLEVGGWLVVWLWWLHTTTAYCLLCICALKCTPFYVGAHMRKTRIEHDPPHAGCESFSFGHKRPRLRPPTIGRSLANCVCSPSDAVVAFLYCVFVVVRCSSPVLLNPTAAKISSHLGCGCVRVCGCVNSIQIELNICVCVRSSQCADVCVCFCV